MPVHPFPAAHAPGGRRSQPARAWRRPTPRTSQPAVLPAVLLALALLLCLPAPAAAEGLVLRNFVLDNQEGNMTLRFSIGLDDSLELEELRDMLLEGAVLRLECQAGMQRKRGYWLDEPLATGWLQNTLRADPQRDLFILEQPDDRVVRAGSLEQLLAEAWRSMSITLGPFSLLERGQAYSVGLEVELKLQDVPAWKRWTLFYSDFEVVPGAHYQMDFEY